MQRGAAGAGEGESELLHGGELRHHHLRHGHHPAIAHARLHRVSKDKNTFKIIIRILNIFQSFLNIFIYERFFNDNFYFHLLNIFS